MLKQRAAVATVSMDGPTPIHPYPLGRDVLTQPVPDTQQGLGHFSQHIMAKAAGNTPY